MGTCSFRWGDGWEEFGTPVGMATSGSVVSALCNRVQVGKVSFVSQCFTSWAVKRVSATCQGFVLPQKSCPCCAFSSVGFTRFWATSGTSKAPFRLPITHPEPSQTLETFVTNLVLLPTSNSPLRVLQMHRALLNRTYDRTPTALLQRLVGHGTPTLTNPSTPISPSKFNFAAPSAYGAKTKSVHDSFLLSWPLGSMEVLGTKHLQVKS